MAPDQAAPVPAGWYPDPYHASELRWWDGQNWTDSVHPPVAPPVVEAPAPPVQPDPVPVNPAPATQASAEPAPVEATPAQQTPAFPTPAPEFLAPPTTPPLVEPQFPQPPAASPPVASPPQAQPVEPPATLQEPAAQEPPVQAPATHAPAQAPATQLPSRRELRARSGDTVDDAPASTVPASTAPANPAPTATGLPPVPASVPDSAAPTAFDWLNANNGPPLGPGATTAAPAQAQAQAHEPTQAPAEAARSDVIFPSADPVSGPAPADPTNAWAQESRPIATSPEELYPPTSVRKHTVSGWLIATMPLISAILVVGAVKGQENYPRYIPEGIDWWMLAGGVVAVLYIVTIILAITDRRKLDWSGFNRPAHWAWAILTAPVYLLVRTIAVKRETGGNSILLWIWILLAAVVVGSWFAADYFAPELIDGYTLPFL